MIEVANKLNAKVQGDDGEIYNDKKESLEKAGNIKQRSWIEKILGK